MALKDQMEMNFGDVPDNTIGIDPVSGNEIPLGSNAENVRDDIPSNLSEGEIVIPADVVNFHGVKLFEDLRAEAKMGYAQMAADGRIGGEPMMEDMDIEITIEDLDVMDDEEPVDMARGGTSMAQYKGVTKNRNIKSSKPMTAAQHQAKIRGGSLTRRGGKPPVVKTNIKQPSAPVPTIGAQINFPGFEDTTVPAQTSPSKPQSPTMGSTPTISTSAPAPLEPQMTPAERARAIQGFEPSMFEKGIGFIRNKLSGDKETDTGTAASGTKYNQTGTVPSLGPDPLGSEYRNQLAKERLLQFGKDAVDFINPFSGNEGGLVNPEPFYSQKGGFDLSSTNTVVVEYMNDEGHRIFITFVDGVPQMEIPEGYYPAGDAVSLDDVVNYTIPTMEGVSPEPVQQSSSDRDRPETPAPTPVNYKELSIDELKDMIADQRTMGSKIFAGLSPLTKLIMWDQTRRTKAEIERRIADPNTSGVDLMRLKNLKELLDKEEPGLIKTLLDKVQGKEFERIVSQVKPPVKLDYDFDDPTEAPDQGIAKPYTPDPQESSQMTMPFEGSTYDEVVPMTTPGVDSPVTPGVPLTRAQIEAAKKASEEAAAVAFGQPEVEEEAAPAEQAVPFTPTPISKDEQRRKDRQETSKNLQGKSTKRKTGLAQSATRGLSSREKQGGAALDTRFGISGLNKGGLAQTKGTKKKSK